MASRRQLQLVKQGAEARIYTTTYLGRPAVVKERFRKAYRHPDLDQHITRERMRAEARAIIKCKAAGVHTPTLYLVDLQQSRIYMQDVCGKTVKNYLQEVSGTEEGNAQLNFVTEGIGKAIGKMHSNNIIHGDLTTSNMLVVNEKDIVFIDFGLSAAEGNTEDKGVDLYVLERALVSTHADAQQLFLQILEAYKREYRGAAEVLKKFAEVQARGRKRTMVG